MKLAPILIQVYTRKKHFINCVESLAQCRLADQTHLIIASDAGKNEADQQIVQEIRDYCSSLTEFGKVEVLAFEKNIGVHEAFDRAIDRIFSEYDRLIYTEDDNVFSPNFLEYINGGLEYYKNNPNVFAICGYKYPFQMPRQYFKDVFASQYISAWGFGVWKEKYLEVDFYPQRIEIPKKQIKQMSRCWQSLMTNVISDGKVYGDALMEYHCLKNNMVNIFPVISLVQNHGNDGSGVHCTLSPEYAGQEICTGQRVFRFIGDISILPTIKKRVTNAIDFPFKSAFERFYLKVKYKMYRMAKNILLWSKNKRK